MLHPIKANPLYLFSSYQKNVAQSVIIFQGGELSYQLSYRDFGHLTLLKLLSEQESWTPLKEADGAHISNIDHLHVFSLTSHFVKFLERILAAKVKLQQKGKQNPSLQTVE